MSLDPVDYHDAPAAVVFPQTSMRVTKRNGKKEPVDLNKIVRAVTRCCVGLTAVDPLRIATRTIAGLHDGATTKELDKLSIETAASLIIEEPQYSRLAAQLLATFIRKEVQSEDVHAFSQSAFCTRWIDTIQDIDALNTRAERRQFVLNLVCFAACIEGLFFFGAFAYVYFLRSRGLLHGLAAGTNWVFRDESAHMAFAFAVLDVVRREEPELFDAALEGEIVEMLEEAIVCETQFAEDMLQGGVVGLTPTQVRQYLEFCADQRLTRLGFEARYHVTNPFPFMDLQDVQELANFFERRVSAYQVGVTGEVDLHADF